MAITPSPTHVLSNANSSCEQAIATQACLPEVENDSEMLTDTEQQKLILARFWLCKVLCSLKKPKDFFQANDLHAKVVEEYFDIELRDPDDDAQITNAMSQITSKFDQVAAESERLYALQPAFVQNLETLKNELNLNEAETNLLLFFTVFSEHNALEVVDRVKKAPSPLKKAIVALSFIFENPEREFRNAFSHRSSLYKSGLLRLNRNGFLDYLESFEVASSTKACLFDFHPNKDELCSPLMRVAQPAELKPSDFVGMEKDIQLCTHYLSEAIKKQQCGVNILVYGSPGTGKTQFVKVISELTQLELLEVPSQEYNHEPIDGIKRLQYAQQTSRIHRTKPFMLLFDEAEDTFSGSIFNGSVASRHKAWINEFLETNLVPIFWVSNDIVEMDAAAIRRFDMIINFDDVTPSDRKAQFENVLSESVSNRLLHQMAAHKPLTTAIVQKCDRMAMFQLQAKLNSDYSKCLVRAINNCLGAQNLEPLQVSQEISYAFDARFVQCDFDLEVLAEHIKTEKSARICLYGPPGTGKTAFSRWLGEKADMPVNIKRASDLKSKYVGENERNIAKAFVEAKSEHAILMFDEVDSFLSERRNTSHSWETSSINELLTQLESFEGVFIASTNLMDSLDQAAMRRFDLKIRFDYLQAGQCEILLENVCKELGLPEPNASARHKVRTLQNLTPGDFMVIKRQHKLQPLHSAEMIVAKLVHETQYKGGVTRRIGF